MSLIGLLGYCGLTGLNSFNQIKNKISTTWKTMELTLLMFVQRYILSDILGELLGAGCLIRTARRSNNMYIFKSHQVASRLIV